MTVRISFLWTSIECHSWGSRAEMERHLACFECLKIIIESKDQEREFYSVIVRPEFQVATNIQQIALGVCSEGIGLQPQLLTLSEFNMILIGANSQVTAVDVVTGKIAFQTRLEGIFYNMTYLSDQKIILIIDEIGVTSLEANGRKLWAFFAHDVVKGVSIENRLLYLSFMDNEPVALDLASGKEVFGAGGPKPARTWCEQLITLRKSATRRTGGSRR